MVGTRRPRFRYRIAKESARAAELGARKGDEKDGEGEAWESGFDEAVALVASMAVGEVDSVVMPAPLTVPEKISTPTEKRSCLRN